MQSATPAGTAEAAPALGGACGPVATVVVVAGMTLREMVRKRLFTLSLALTAVFVGLYGLGLHYAARELLGDAGAAVGPLAGSELLVRRAVAGAQLETAGLYLASLLVAFVSALACAGAVQGEVESGLLQVVAARPVPRWAILLGKYTGYACAFVPYTAAVFAAVTGLVRWQLTIPSGGFWPALATFCLIPLVMLALSVTASVWLAPVAGGALSVILLGIAMVGGMLEQIGALAQAETVERIGVLASFALPSDALYRRVAALLVGGVGGGGDPLDLLARAGPFGAASLPSGWMVAYAVVYAAGLLAVAVVRFESRDL
ncbi:MAG: ABC transporter permease [Clostridia bacterium]|nr:ABC transporter permease [Clostridia bacterium]